MAKYHKVVTKQEVDAVGAFLREGTYAAAGRALGTVGKKGGRRDGRLGANAASQAGKIVIERLHASGDMLEIMDRAGFTQEYIVDKLKDLAEATSTVQYNPKWKRRKVPDNVTRHNVMVTALKVRGEIKDRVQLEPTITDEDIQAELARLRAKAKVDKVDKSVDKS